MWHTMLNVFRSNRVYSYLHLQQFDIFPIAKFQPIDRMSIEYMIVGLIEGGPDPDFDPRWHRFVIYHEF